MHLVIDGYNLIHADPQLQTAHARGEGRSALALALSLYRRTRSHRITLVYDGDPPQAKGESFPGVKVVFSGPLQSADDAIAQICLREKHGITVVTNDRQLSDRCRANGAEIIPCTLFAEKLLEAALYQDLSPEPDPQEGWDFTTKKKGPSHRLPKAQRRRQRKLENI